MPDPIAKDEPLQGNGFSWEWGMEVAELKEVETDDKPNQVPKAMRGYGSEQSPKQNTDAQCTNAKAQGTTCRSTKLQRGHRRLVLNYEGAWDYKLQGKPPDASRHPHFAEHGTVRLGASMKVIDIGGGLGIDYDGSKSANSDVSVGCTLEDYTAAIVQAVKFVCDRKSVKHPVICSESGRAIVSHHPILMLMVGCARQEIRGIVGGKSRCGEVVNVDSNRTLLFNRIKACLWVWIMPTCFWLLNLHFGPSSIFGPLPSDRPTKVGRLFKQQSDSARANTQQPWIGFANNRLEDKSSFETGSIDTILPLGSRVIGKQGEGN